MTSRKALAALSTPFDPSEVYQRDGLDYLSIDTVQDRLDEVMGGDWDVHIADASVTPTEYKFGRKQADAYLAQVTVHLTLNFADEGVTVRAGVGADFASDPDKAYKTALANAIKKAANQFGVGRYLWSASERDILAEQRKAMASINSMKRALHARAALHIPGEADPRAVAEYYDVEVEDLNDPDTLKRLVLSHVGRA